MSNKTMRSTTIPVMLVCFLLGCLILNGDWKKCMSENSISFDESEVLQNKLENMVGNLVDKSDVLPKKLYVIYGLESSGTTFMAKTIASALGIPPRLQPDTVESSDNSIHIQHLSLPLGAIGMGQWGYNVRNTEPLGIVPVYYPTGCRVGPFRNKPPSFKRVPGPCQSAMGKRVMTSPHRYFVNVSSHVQWYRERGVEVYPIMVIRDPSFHFYGVLISPGHCRNETAAYLQYEMGRKILVESIHNVQPTIVSYETLMTVQKEYLMTIYNQTNVQTSYIPNFQNGNLKHLAYDTPTYIKEKLQLDGFGRVFNETPFGPVGSVKPGTHAGVISDEAFQELLMNMTGADVQAIANRLQKAKTRRAARAPRRNRAASSSNVK